VTRKGWWHGRSQASEKEELTAEIIKGKGGETTLRDSGKCPPAQYGPPKNRTRGKEGALDGPGCPKDHGQHGRSQDLGRKG